MRHDRWRGLAVLIVALLVAALAMPALAAPKDKDDKSKGKPAESAKPAAAGATSSGTTTGAKGGGTTSGGGKSQGDASPDRHTVVNLNIKDPEQATEYARSLASEIGVQVEAATRVISHLNLQEGRKDAKKTHEVERLKVIEGKKIIYHLNRIEGDIHEVLNVKIYLTAKEREALALKLNESQRVRAQLEAKIKAAEAVIGPVPVTVTGRGEVRQDVSAEVSPVGVTAERPRGVALGQVSRRGQAPARRANAPTGLVLGASEMQLPFGGVSPWTEALLGTGRWLGAGLILLSLLLALRTRRIGTGDSR